MAKIVIHVDGGLVQYAFLLKNKAYPGKDITGLIIVDTDVEGADPDLLTTITDSDGQEAQASVHEEELVDMPADCDIEKFVKEWLNSTGG